MRNKNINGLQFKRYERIIQDYVQINKNRELKSKV